MFPLDKTTMRRVLALVETRLLTFRHTPDWARARLDAGDSAPWLEALAAATRRPDIEGALRAFVFAEPVEGFDREQIADDEVVALLLRHERGELSWASFLATAGQRSDASNEGRWDVSHFYAMLNELEEAGYDCALAERQRAQVRAAFAEPLERVLAVAREFPGAVRERQHLSLVTLVVDDQEAAKQYFTEVLGFECREDRAVPAEGKRWLVVAPPGGGTGLLLARAATDAQAARIGDPTGGRVSFFLHTDDFDRDHRRSLERGVVFEEEPRDEEYGRVAVFRDRWGNRWDLVEPRAG